MLLVTRRGDRSDLHVVAEIERGRVHPHGPTQPERRHGDDLAEPREEMQPEPDRVPCGVESEATVCAEEAAAVQDG